MCSRSVAWNGNDRFASEVLCDVLFCLMLRRFPSVRLILWYGIRNVSLLASIGLVFNGLIACSRLYSFSTVSNYCLVSCFGVRTECFEFLSCEFRLMWSACWCSHCFCMCTNGRQQQQSPHETKKLETICPITLFFDPHVGGWHATCTWLVSFHGGGRDTFKAQTLYLEHIFTCQ